MRQDWQRLIDQTIQDERLRHAYAWEPFAKGSSNSIFVGRANKNHQTTLTETVVLRINAPAKDTPGVVRQREADILKLIMPFNWAPQIIRNEPDQGWCLMHHYAPINLEDQPAERLSSHHEKQLLEVLNELQAIPENSTELHYDYHALLNDIYQPIAIERQDSAAHTWIQSIKHDLAALPKLPSCLVHHDIHLGNLVLIKSAKAAKPNTQLVILDWEYAAIGNPWFDASCLSRYLSMTPKHIHTLAVFKTFDEITFNSGLARANQVTEVLQKLWYWARE